LKAATAAGGGWPSKKLGASRNSSSPQNNKSFRESFQERVKLCLFMSSILRRAPPGSNARKLTRWTLFVTAQVPAKLRLSPTSHRRKAAEIDAYIRYTCHHDR
jgi:hypothetical protein